MIHTELI